MKINKLFHWLYAFLMGLPLLSSLWIGLIWTFNENAQVPTITENVSKEISLNQYFDIRTYNRVVNNVSVSSSQSTGAFTFLGIPSSTGGRTSYQDFFGNHSITLYYDHIYYFKVSSDYPFGKITFYSNYDSSTFYRLQPNVLWTNNIRTEEVYFGWNFEDTVFDFNNTFYINLFDLTEAFGAGNEPTITDFDRWFTDSYYSYGIHHLVIEDYTTREILDSPINYIWLPSFGGIGWTIENVFNQMLSGMFGLATSYGIGLTIVKLLTYWLCISLIWLIYDVIMYVPLMIHRWLDKGVIS